MKIDAVPYRTPACDKHLPDNDSDECPWCRIEELENPAMPDDVAEMVKDARRYPKALNFTGEYVNKLADMLVRHYDP